MNWWDYIIFVINQFNKAHISNKRITTFDLVICYCWIESLRWSEGGVSVARNIVGIESGINHEWRVLRTFNEVFHCLGDGIRRILWDSVRSWAVRDPTQREHMENAGDRPSCPFRSCGLNRLEIGECPIVQPGDFREIFLRTIAQRMPWRNAIHANNISQRILVVQRIQEEHWHRNVLVHVTHRHASIRSCRVLEIPAAFRLVDRAIAIRDQIEDR